MLYPLMAQTEMHGDAEFTCQRLCQKVHVAKCMQWYVDHTALGRNTSACHKCPQGAQNRTEFAKS